MLSFYINKVKITQTKINNMFFCRVKEFVIPSEPIVISSESNIQKVYTKINGFSRFSQRIDINDANLYDKLFSIVNSYEIIENDTYSFLNDLLIVLDAGVPSTDIVMLNDIDSIYICNINVYDTIDAINVESNKTALIERTNDLSPLEVYNYTSTSEDATTQEKALIFVLRLSAIQQTNVALYDIYNQSQTYKSQVYELENNNNTLKVGQVVSPFVIDYNSFVSINIITTLNTTVELYEGGGNADELLYLDQSKKYLKLINNDDVNDVIYYECVFDNTIDTLSDNLVKLSQYSGELVYKHAGTQIYSPLRLLSDDDVFNMINSIISYPLLDHLTDDQKIDLISYENSITNYIDYDVTRELFNNFVSNNVFTNDKFTSDNVVKPNSYIANKMLLNLSFIGNVNRKKNVEHYLNYIIDNSYLDFIENLTQRNSYLVNIKQTFIDIFSSYSNVKTCLGYDTINDTLLLLKNIKTYSDNGTYKYKVTTDDLSKFEMLFNQILTSYTNSDVTVNTRILLDFLTRFEYICV